MCTKEPETRKVEISHHVQTIIYLAIYLTRLPWRSYLELFPVGLALTISAQLRLI